MSLPKYAEYKVSGVEWIGLFPAHWALKRLRFVAELNPSKSEVAGLDRETEVSFLPMEAISDDGSLKLDKMRPIREVETGYTYFRDGDVTLAKITPCFENGKGALMKGLQGGIGFGTTELIVARPKAGQSSGDFLNWIFRSPNFRQQGEASMYGAGGQKRVPDDFVRDLVWAFPSLSEQATIAAFLDRETGKIDVLIAEQEKLIALLAEKREATISHAVTRGLNPDASVKNSGVAWLGEVPAHWKSAQLKHLCLFLKDGTHLPPPRVDQGVPLLSVRNINESAFTLREDDSMISQHDYAELCRAFIPQDGDVLLAIVGATLGKVAIIPRHLGQFHIQRSLAIFRTSPTMLNRWLFYCISSGAFQRQLWENVGFSAQPGIYLGTLQNFKMPVPSIREQVELCDFLDFAVAKIDTLKAEAKRAISLLKERRSALIAAAVTGQIDVRGAVALPSATTEAIAA